jgi:hypothetical protein
VLSTFSESPRAKKLKIVESEVQSNKYGTDSQQQNERGVQWSLKQ